MTDIKRKPQQKAHWYLTYTRECVLCGAGDTRRERIYGKKPKDVARRYDYTQFACPEHFM